MSAAEVQSMSVGYIQFGLDTYGILLNGGRETAGFRSHSSGVFLYGDLNQPDYCGVLFILGNILIDQNSNVPCRNDSHPLTRLLQRDLHYSLWRDPVF